MSTKLVIKVHLPPKNKFLTITSLDSGIPEKWFHSFVLALIIEYLPLKVATCQKNNWRPGSHFCGHFLRSQVQNSPTPSHPGQGYKTSPPQPTSTLTLSPLYKTHNCLASWTAPLETERQERQETRSFIYPYINA